MRMNKVEHPVFEEWWLPVLILFLSLFLLIISLFSDWELPSLLCSFAAASSLLFAMFMVVYHAMTGSWMNSVFTAASIVLMLLFLFFMSAGLARGLSE